MNIRVIFFILVSLFLSTHTVIEKKYLQLAGLSVLALYCGYNLAKKIEELPGWHPELTATGPSHVWKISGKKLIPVILQGATTGVLMFLIHSILNKPSNTVRDVWGT